MLIHIYASMLKLTWKEQPHTAYVNKARRDSEHGIDARIGAIAHSSAALSLVESEVPTTQELCAIGQI